MIAVDSPLAAYRAAAESHDVAAALGPRVAARRSRTRALAVRAMIAPLAFLTRRGEGMGSRLAAP